MDKKIIQEYQEGKSISQILRDYPQYNRRQINKILLDNNITIRGGRKKKDLTNEQIAEIKKMISEGAFLKEVAEYCNLDRETMRKKLNELNIEITNTNRVNRRIDSFYFNKIDSPIKAYWLGFLYTDGSVDHYGATGRVRLQLQARDLHILEQFKEDLKIDSKIIYDKRDNSQCCSVEFVDEQIFNDLSNYSIIPNKTYTVTNLPLDKIPEQYLAAFALGLFDGDGGFSCDESYSKDVTLSYTAYHETEVKDFQKLINSLAAIDRDNRCFFTSAWHCSWRGRLQVLKILDILYQSCPRHLNRKYEKYLRLKDSLS